MEITSRIIGAYRGYQIAELREKTTQEDYDNEMFDWVKQLMLEGFFCPLFCILPQKLSIFAGFETNLIPHFALLSQL